MDSRRVTTSMSLIALICFFLPWVHLSCGTSENRLSGVDLARDGHSGLWLIPVLMLVVLPWYHANLESQTRCIDTSRPGLRARQCLSYESLASESRRYVRVDRGRIDWLVLARTGLDNRPCSRQRASLSEEVTRDLTCDVSHAGHTLRVLGLYFLVVVMLSSISLHERIG